MIGPRLLSNDTEAFGEDNQLVPRKLVMLDGLANQLLRDSARIDVGRIPGVQPTVVGSLEQLEN